jgi:cell division protein FtsZ
MPDSYSLDIEATKEQSSYIKVIGVGGAGTNAVNHMYNKGITGVDFIVCNTDEQSLNASPIMNKIKIGEGGLGAGNNPEVAKKAAVAAAEIIKKELSNNTHMLFITAGMGGGTGTGASPEIAKIAKQVEVDGGKDELLVVGVVTIPFSFEGRKRREQAKEGIENLRKVVDAIIVVNTDKLKTKGKMSMKSAFAMADDVLLTAAKGISEMMTSNAYIHVDFKDVQSIMQHSGVALMGSGVGEGEDRAFEAIKAATTSDLLNDNDLSQTKNILLYLSFSSKEEYELQMEEMDTITQYIQEQTNRDVNIIWGYGYDDTLEAKLSITLVATGFEPQEIYNDSRNLVDTKTTTPIIKQEVPEKNTSDTDIKIPEPIIINRDINEEYKKETQPIKDQLPINNDLNDFTISTIGDEEVKQEEDKKKDNVRLDGKRIIGSLIEEDKKEETSQTKEEPKQDDMTREEAFKILNQANKQDEKAMTETKTTDVLIEKQPIEEDKEEVVVGKTLNDIIYPKAIYQDKIDEIAMTPAQRLKQKGERIRLVREMIQTDKGLTQIETSTPDVEIKRVISKEEQKSNQISILENGDIKISENKAINSSVD